jgi:hypothetical protein
MTDRRSGATQLALAFAAVLAVIGALALVFTAAFPYFYAESGSASYARAHRGEAIGELALAVGLVFVAWQCMRRSLSPRTWTIIGACVLGLIAFEILRDYWKTPEHARPIGDRWYVTKTSEPREIDTVYYSLYYKRGLRYQPVQDLAAEYRFVPPDCVIYRGLKVSGRPLYAMCGYHSPFQSEDTLLAGPELLARARARPAYGSDRSR